MSDSGKDKTARLALLGLIILAVGYAVHVNYIIDHQEKQWEIIQKQISALQK